MRALLLAAGMGSRISRYINGKPKCMVDIGNGTPLIRHTVRTLKAKGINEIAICTGYKHEVLEKELKNEGIALFRNPFYSITNSIASAWFARDFLKPDDDYLIMNADVFCEDKIFDLLLSLDKLPVMLADSSRKECADYKFYFENGRLLKFGKELVGDDISGEYVGIAKLSGAFIPEFIKSVDVEIEKQHHGVWWENAIYDEVEKMFISVEDIKGLFWAEVDYIEDYERIKEYVKENNI